MKGLGKIQRSNRSNTDWKVYEYLAWCNKNKKNTWFTQIKLILKMDSVVLRKSLDRLVASDEVKEYTLYTNEKKDRLGRIHNIFYKGYKVL